MTQTAAPTAQPADGRSRRRWARRLGLLLIVAGLAVLGYVGWQFWGTTWLSHKTQERIVTDVQKDWDKKPGATGETGSANGAVEVPEGDVTALVRIPRFGDDYVVPVLEGTDDDVLAAGYGHFAGSAEPGKVGNYALAAHRITHGEPLRGMPDLEVGDEVVVETRAATYTYALTSAGDALTVPFTSVWVVDPLPDNPEEGGVEPEQEPGQRLLTLTTCSELFHTDNRLVAFGVLVDREPRT
ncbi:MAG: class E sortase [Nocardioides sp.]